MQAVAAALTPFLTSAQLTGSLAQRVYDDWKMTYAKDAGSATGLPSGSKYVRMDVSDCKNDSHFRDIATSESTA